MGSPDRSYMGHLAAVVGNEEELDRDVRLEATGVAWQGIRHVRSGLLCLTQGGKQRVDVCFCGQISGVFCGQLAQVVAEALIAGVKRKRNRVFKHCNRLNIVLEFT